MDSCVATGSGLAYSGGLSFTGNLAYLVSGNPATPAVEVCSLNVDGTFGACTASALPAGANPIAVLVAGSHAYVTDQAAGIYLCTVSPVDGSLSHCTVSNGGATFYLPTQIVIY